MHAESRDKPRSPLTGESVRFLLERNKSPVCESDDSPFTRRKSNPSESSSDVASGSPAPLKVSRPPPILDEKWL
jgi:hypothetical protein